MRTQCWGRSPLRPLLPIFGTLLALSLLACQKPADQNSQPPPPPPPTVNPIFVNGDPIAFADGTVLNAKSFINDSNIHELDGVEGYAFAFLEKTETAATDYKSMTEVEESNKPREADSSAQKVTTFVLSKQDEREDGSNLSYKLANDDLQLLLEKDKGGSFQVTEVAIKSRSDRSFRVLHYSSSPDLSRFSFLMYFPGASKMLMSITFSKAHPQVQIEKADEKFEYMFGKGVKIGWKNNKTIPFNLCGKDGRRFKNELTDAVEPWNAPLKGKLSIQVKAKDKCPPFSDVNFKGLYFIGSYLTLASTEYLNPASTVLVPNISRGALIDGDIFFFKSEYQKALARRGLTWNSPFDSAKIFSRTMTHEFGHLLGLHHKFDKSTDSIMSYNSAQREISDYDTKAIQELYTASKNKKRRGL
jgi:hypothetical protein